MDLGWEMENVNQYIYIYYTYLHIHMYIYTINIYMCQRVASKNEFQGFLASIVPPPEEV